ncbi:UspA domain-containing protein [Oleidesulfovibrio alaskensis G20]|uniref:UspA domain-containing protein n=1 Tax=Oleidesulfovibrio alaskensis (strain ATCC BAA-1058 / DSM 17464 / G20) TaxID=207559 RepID=Q30XS3_OLEA2|nr:universal stress protein [Oleidesulfovibrio alaskensis]ABB39523.1 UspA domain-containing protein [Oleidesulfovibrio alaskensis G20]MBG0772411.1 universal stress protein [Oleidesulfovibrio alaskensis]MBL3582227.1 universal stress protein [Oleidesulfovibrio alaskensis]
MEIRKILVPVDGSACSEKAAEYAANLAQLVGASVLVVNCRMALPPMLGRDSWEQARSALVKRSEVLLESYCDRMKDEGVEAACRVLEGAVDKAIAETAEAENCDLIVMGSRGHSELEGLLLGSVTHRVLQLADCPVTVIR